VSITLRHPLTPTIRRENDGDADGNAEGAAEGDVDGDAVGAGVSHVLSLALHRPLVQSRAPFSHFLPGSHGRQYRPPQSTSLSSPFSCWSLHHSDVGLLVGLLVGDAVGAFVVGLLVVGAGVGCGVGRRVGYCCHEI